MNTPLHHAIALLLAVGVPIWDYVETRALRQSRQPEARLRTYRRTIAWLWLFTVVLLATTPPALLFRPLPAGRLGQVLPQSVAISMMVGVLAALLAGTVAPLLLARRNPEARERVLKGLEPLAFFLPRTSRERRWFAAVSLSAGVCEEVIYRGFLIRYLDAMLPVLGLVGAILVAALIFGMGHGYQGVSGVAATGITALLFTALFYLTGGLWLPVVLHALINLRLLILLPPEWSPTPAAQSADADDGDSRGTPR